MEAAREWDNEHSVKYPIQIQSTGMVDSANGPRADHLLNRAKLESLDGFDTPPMEFQALRALIQNAHFGPPFLMEM